MGIDPISLGITLALTAAQMAMTASQTHEGPRLDNLKVQTGDYGAPLPISFAAVRTEGIPIWAEDLKEVKRRRKTKGGKYNEYTYYGTWAVAIAGHQISQVEKIRFDTHLIYELVNGIPTMPFQFTEDEDDAPTLGELLTIYLGTEDQNPDPRMRASIEAQRGVGYCPGYRGTAYAVFKDVPLEKIGNRIPQSTFEYQGILGSTITASPYLELTFPYPEGTIDDHPGGYELVVSSSINYFSFTDSETGEPATLSGIYGTWYQSTTDFAYEEPAFDYDTDEFGNARVSLTTAINTTYSSTFVANATQEWVFKANEVVYTLTLSNNRLSMGNGYLGDINVNYEWGVSGDSNPGAYDGEVLCQDNHVIPYTKSWSISATLSKVHIYIWPGNVKDHFGSQGGVVEESELLLKDVAEYISDLCGITSYDYSLLTQPVQGWYVTHGTAENMLEPLFDIYDTTLRLNGFTLEGIVRGQAPTETIVLEEDAILTRPLYKLEQVQPQDLPGALVIAYSDINMDKQPNLARDVRGYDVIGTGEEEKISMATWTSDPDEAQQLVNRKFRRMWNADVEATFTLPNHHFDLLPGDVKAINADNNLFSAMCNSLTYDFGRDSIIAEWEEDYSGLANLDGSSGAPFMGAEPQAIKIPVETHGFVLDIPYIVDSDVNTNPLLYMLTGPNDPDGYWPGATMFSPVDGEYVFEEETWVSHNGMIHGVADTALGSADPGLWDRGNFVDITLTYGILESVTEQAAEEDPLLNMCWFQGELMQFTGAELIGVNQYRISGFRRGMRGTEQFIDTHAIGDEFVLLDSTYGDERGLSEVGTSLNFKPITLGTSALSTGVIPVDFTGATLKPYAVIDVTATWDGNDIDFAWERRTRLGGAWTSGTTTPLSELTEEYEIDVMDGLTVVNTYVVTSPTWTYLEADQITDWGSAQTDVTVRIYQMSDAVGRGFVREVSFAA